MKEKPVFKTFENLYSEEKIKQIDKLRDDIKDLCNGKAYDVGLNAVSNALIDISKQLQKEDRRYVTWCTLQFIKVLETTLLDVPRTSGDKGNKETQSASPESSS